MATTGTERYVTIMLLTFEGGPWISKKILLREVDRAPGSHTLETLIRTKESFLKQEKDRGAITRKQFNLLFPSGGSDMSIDDCDLSLLVKIIMFFFRHNLTDHEKSDLNEILKIRNDEICHLNKTEITEREFFALWTRLTTSLKRLALGFDKDTDQYAADLIAKFLHGPLDLKTSVQRLNELCRNDEHMEQILAALTRLKHENDQIAIGVASANIGVASANAKLDDVLAKLQELKEHGQCQADVPMLNSEVVVRGQNEEDVNFAQKILLKVFQSAIKQADDPMDNASVRKAVQKVLDDLTSKGAVTQSAENGSIILILKCFDLDGLANILTLFIREGNRCRLVGIEHALVDLFAVKLEVDLVLPEDTIETLSTWIGMVNPFSRTAFVDPINGS